jgi:hypothetical protein
MDTLLEFLLHGLVMIVVGVSVGAMIDRLTGGRIWHRDSRPFATWMKDKEALDQERKEIQETWQRIKSEIHEQTRKPD